MITPRQAFQFFAERAQQTTPIAHLQAYNEASLVLLKLIEDDEKMKAAAASAQLPEAPVS